MARAQKPLTRRIGEATLVVALLPIVLPLAAVGLFLYWLHQITLYVLVWLLWLPRGKDVLLVYSDSPIWHDYMITEVLPLVENRAIVLNWSQRKRWGQWSFSAYVFRSLGGGAEFNPMVAVFRPFHRARIFRFWSAFNYWKHGNTEPVVQLREDLLQSL